MKLELKLTNDWLEATWLEDDKQVHCESFSGHPEHITMFRAKVAEFGVDTTAEDEKLIEEAISNFVMPTQEELDEYAQAQADAQAKADKALALSTLTVTTQSGKVFDGDETARVDMLTAISMASVVGQTSTMWKMADNSIVEVTLAELKEALLLALTKKGEIIGAVSVQP